MRPDSSDRLLALALLAGMVALTAVRLRPPAPLPAGADLSLFSAGRAREHLRAIAGDGRPRPVGSAAGAEAREKIIQALRALGYEPKVQEAFACSAVHTCARVKNVWALRPGVFGTEGPLVMLSAHYDSVPAGPGAGDDAAGVAALLEIARALSLEPPARNPVLFLFNEGEEPGLIGAEAFVDEHPLASQVAVVVNVEARGSSGPSLMFETSEGNGPLLSLYARNLEHPATNSIYYTVYKTLPNDTDLTVFKRGGMAGVNFAFIGGEVHYHTPRDDFAHVDPASLQHHGQNALAMARALAVVNLDELRGEDAVFFDVFTFFVVRWPERWMPALGLLALALVAAGAVLAARRGHARMGQLGWGLLGAAAILLATAAVAGLSLFALRAAGAAPYFFLAFPAPAKVAFWISALAVALPVGSAFLARAGRAGLWLSSSLFLAALGAVASVAYRGLAYPFVVPALVAGAVAIAWALASRPAPRVPRWVWLPPLLVSATVWLPLAWLLYDALGVTSLAGAAAMLSLVLLPLSSLWGPMVEARTLFLASALAWVAGLVVQVASPRFTEEHPRKLNLEYQLLAGDPKPTAKWTAGGWSGGGLPEPLSAAGHFSAEQTQTYPWTSIRKSFAAEAPVLPLQRPTFEVRRAVAAEGKLRVEGRLASPRGALYAGLVLPRARLISMKVNGKAPPLQESKNLVPKLLATGAWLNLMTCTTGTVGADYELELSGVEPLQAYAWDLTFGLPEAGAHLAAARPSNAVPFQVGDATMAIQPISLAPR